MSAALIGSLLIGFSATGDAEDPTVPLVWSSPMITLMIHSAGSDDISDGSDLDAIRAALQVWSAPGCTNLRLVDGGLDNSRTNADDGVNRIFFQENNWPGGLSGAAAVTVSRRTAGSPDTWRDADILLNGRDLSWSTTGEVQRHDVQAVVTHELGHLIGLKHAAHPEATMYFTSPRGLTARRTLHAADVAAVCWLYPAGQRSCTTDDDCPLLIAAESTASARYTCSGGQCTLGQAGYGADCLASGQCTSGTCTGDPDTAAADDPGFCGEACAGATCAGGDLCAMGTCWLGRDDCVSDDDCPGSNNVCAVDLDLRRACTRLCIEDRNCPNGQVCHGGTGQNPPGFCRTPGGGGDGAPCANGYDCASLTCAGAGTETVCAGGLIVPMDAGVADAGRDAGPPRDSGPTPDTGPSPDVPRPDAVTAADAAAAADAGAGDAAEPAPVEGSGCGCSAAGRDAAGTLLALLLTCAAGACARRPRNRG